MSAPITSHPFVPYDANRGTCKLCHFNLGTPSICHEPESAHAAPEPAPWKLRLICCGRDDGELFFPTSDAADDAREAYTSGEGVAAFGYSSTAAESGHRRAAIKEYVEPRAGPAPAAAPEPEELYPCDDCGAMRTKAQGGEIFTVCDACWDKHWHREPSAEPAPKDRMEEKAEQIVFSKCPHDGPGDYLRGACVACVRAALEAVVREAADVAHKKAHSTRDRECGREPILRHWGLEEKP